MNDNNTFVSTLNDEKSCEILYRYEHDDVNDIYKIDGNNPEIVSLLRRFRDDCIRLETRTKQIYNKHHDPSLPRSETLLRRTGCQTWGELLSMVGLNAYGHRKPHNTLYVTFTIHAIDDD